MNEYGICEKCQMDGCQECIFNNSKKECLKCQPNSYLTSNKTCKQCYYSNSIPHGDCIVCSDNYTDFDFTTCHCYNNYYLIQENKTCSFCLEGCSRCILGKDNRPYCLQ